jgi:hypothetical protein
LNRIEAMARARGAALGVEPLEAARMSTPVLCTAVITDAAVGAGAFAARATRHAIIETPGRRAFATFDQGVLHNPRHEVGTASLHGATGALSFGALIGIVDG